ncbi:MAG: dihydroorotase [Patescibacteria group bacterium]
MLTEDSRRGSSELIAFPGLIDCHVHFREPGNTDAEDMRSGAEAAWSGGVTTVCDMPNTDPPTSTVAALREKIARWEIIRNQPFEALTLQQAQGHPERSRGVKGSQALNGKSEIRNIDMRFFFGATKSEHILEFQKVMQSEELKKYVPGVKLYLGHSTGNQKAEEGIAGEVFQVCSKLGLPVVCHCEDEGVIRENQKGLGLGLGLGIDTHSKIRSIEAAVKATTYAIHLAREYGTHLHIAHLSTRDELELVKQAKKEGLRVTCEVAPHHLFLTVDDYKTLGTFAKMNPPLRTHEHTEALWRGIEDKTVDCIASDHAPHTIASKRTKNPLDAPSGVPGAETMLPLLLSCALGEGPWDAQGKPRCQMSDVRFQISDIVRLLYDKPNSIFSLGKPEWNPGKPHSIVVNPRETWLIRGKELHSKCGWTPYEGWKVTGRIETFS